MADRVVEVSLQARVNNYLAGMEQATLATRRATAASTDAAAKFAAQNRAMEAVGRGLVAVGAIAAVSVALAVKKYAEFDRAISNVKAATQETTENMGLLRDAALEAGADSIYTATEAANAIEELGKAGLSTADILSGGLTGSLNLASAGSLDIARAAEIAATTLSQFNLAGTQTGHVADVLAAGAGRALGSVDDLANGLKFVGPVAAAMGISLEQTTGVLALFAQQGIIGEQAGTGLRGMLSSLTSPSKIARDEIARLGITLYDSEGRFLGLENAAGQLQAAYEGATDQQRDLSLGILFGNEQITAARVLYEAGAEGVAEWTDTVSESGYAARIAADRLDNLSGDVEKLGGALDTALIQQGSAANDTLRSLVQGLTFLVDAAGDAPPAAVAIGSVFSAIALTSGASLIAIPKIAEFRTNMQAAGISAKGAAIGIGAASVALTLIGVALTASITKAAENKAFVDSLADSYDDLTGSATEYTRELVTQELSQRDLFDQFQKAGVRQADLVDATLGHADAIERVREQIEKYGATELGSENDDYWTDEAAAAVMLAGELDTLVGQREASIKVWEDETEANREATEATRENAETLADLQNAAGDASEQIEELSDIIRGFGSATLSTRDAQRQFEDAIDSAQASFAEYGATLDVSTAAGRENEASLDALAEAAQEAAAAIYEETGSQELATIAIQNGRQALIDQLAEYGIVGPAAEEYANKLGLIPDDVSTAVNMLNTDTAKGQIDGIAKALNKLPSSVNVTVTARGRSVAGSFAHGGYTGAGSKYQPAGIVHADEWVSTKETLAHPTNRAVLEFMHRGGVMPGYANGGPVTTRPVYMQESAGRGASSMPTPQFNLTVSSKGGVDLLDYVDVRIEAAERSSALTTRMGAI